MFAASKSRDKEHLFPILLGLAFSCMMVSAREWKLNSQREPIPLQIIHSTEEFALVEDDNGIRFEVPVSNFSPSDQKHLQALAQKSDKPEQLLEPNKIRPRRQDFEKVSFPKITGRFLVPEAGSETHLTGAQNVLDNSTIHFTSSDSWLFFKNHRPSLVRQNFLSSLLVNGSPAQLGTNLRIVAHGLKEQ